MSTRRELLMAAGALSLGAGAAAAQTRTANWPGSGSWETLTPQAAGFDPEKLSAAVQAGLADQSASLLVLRGGRMVTEAYAADGGPDRVIEIASAGKSMVSILAGMAIDDGKIKGVEQSASAFIPEWRGTPKEAITVRHLLTMTSGLDDKGLALRNVAGDQAALNAAAPVAYPPGTHWAYATALYHLMFHVVARAVGEPFEAYAQRKLVTPLGMSGTTWLTNVGHDAAGKPVTNYYTARCTARDLARFGLFAAAGGQWNDRRLVSADYFHNTTRPSQALNPAYGYLWWVNAEPGRGPENLGVLRHQLGETTPLDAFAALGAGGQDVMVVPSLDLVVVRQGTQFRGAATPAVLLPSVVAALNKA
jgi:CubicO group peptidase (beta-lactamase class C family)